MPSLIFNLNNQAHDNADQERKRNGQYFQIGTDFGRWFPSGYMIVKLVLCPAVVILGATVSLLQIVTGRNLQMSTHQIDIYLMVTMTL